VGRSSVNVFKTAVLFLLLITGPRNASASAFIYLEGDSSGPVPVIEKAMVTDSAGHTVFLFEKYLRAGKYSQSLQYVGNIETLVRGNNLAIERKIYLIYMVGICYSGNGINDKAAASLYKALDLLNQHPVDSLIGRVFYNLGVVCDRTGDYILSESFFLKSLEIKKRTFRKSDPALAFEYLVLSINSIRLRNYEKSLDFANDGLWIVKAKPDSVSKDVIALLYQTKGTALSSMLDYHQSVLNYKKASELYDDGLSKETDEYINMLSNIITVYYFLGQIDLCSFYFKKGENIFSLFGTMEMFNLYLNYSSILAENNLDYKGYDLLTREFNRLQKAFTPDSREFNYAMQKYAGFLLEYKIDPGKSIDLYYDSYKYLRSHPWDISLGNEIALGYALAIAEEGKIDVALDSVRSILFREAGLSAPSDYFTNPNYDSLKEDKITFDILYAKYRVLRMLSVKENDQERLESAANTAELMIYVLEKIRLNIGEEQSRLLLGNKYRIAYLNVIQSMCDCYKSTGNSKYLEKAFEYSEKSKASSLLAYIREMKALEGVIPPDLANLERDAEKRIGDYMMYIADELSLEKPDTRKLELWNEVILASTNTRDSLKNEFSSNYPDYYSLKYNTRVVSISEIQNLIGKKKNYLSYVVSDSLVYIMVVNSKYARIERIRTDTSFANAVLRYRGLLSSPNRGKKAASEFNLFQRDGYFLYKILIEPIRPFLISDELILSPDNTLAYFPFETLVTSDNIRDDLQYKNLSYLMRDFRISYAYSATLLSESPETRRTYRNRVAAFVPSYKKPVDINTLWVNRQESNGTLPELKYAPEEAGFVAKLTSGKLFRDSAASKDLFISFAGSFDILHLAMHTVLNNNDPSNSGMIFSDSDTLGDNILNPYDIYAMRLNAKMVVLSSCFTGVGTLFAGEGVLSIARGFIFSGSRSVVMSLWEVDDRSGTEIIKSFYRNLKAGRSKSESLRKARVGYLKNADMLHAHPYFWSTMVIYGDDSPVYINWFTRIMFLMIPLLLGFFVYNYFRKR
jgi:CHAT domain-containing protein